MKASELLSGCGLTKRAADCEISTVVSDSRRVTASSLFICICGTHRDGHDHAAEAFRNGAVRILSQHPVDGVPDDCLFLVPDTRAAESRIWYNFTGRPTDGMKKIAVTGTAGKTSCASMLAHILRAAGHRVGLITTAETLSGAKPLNLGTQGGSSVADAAGAMTTPDPEYFFGACAQFLADGCDTLVYEASSQAIVQHKLDPLEHDAVIFTNLSPEHLDCHGTMENYFCAKASLMKHTRCAVVNTDDAWMEKLGGMFPDVPVISCSADPSKAASADVCALRYKADGAGGLEYVYFSEHAVFRITAPLFGKFSVINSLEAAACAVHLGVNPLTVKEALSDFPGVRGRMMRVQPAREDSCLPCVFIDYAHTPEALTAALQALRSVTKGKLAVLFGCGGDRDRTKRPLMAAAAQKYADDVIVTSDNPRTEDPDAIIKEICEGFDTSVPVTVIPDRRRAIFHAVRSFGGDDIVLCAGKGHEQYEITADGKKPFDEEKIVLQAMREKCIRQNNI